MEQLVVVRVQVERDQVLDKSLEEGLQLEKVQAKVVLEMVLHLQVVEALVKLLQEKEVQQVEKEVDKEQQLQVKEVQVHQAQVEDLVK